MTVSYARKVQLETPSKLFVNNPTLSEAGAALGYDVIGATTNPTYLSRLAGLDSEKDGFLAAMQPLLARHDDDLAVFEELQKLLVGRIATLYLPIYVQTGGRRGLVFMQGNPLMDADDDYMVQEALRFFEIAPNIVVKVPSNHAGLKAFQRLTAMGKNLCATSGLSLSQEEVFFRAYRDIHGNTPQAPLAYVTSLAGILEEFARKYAAEHAVHISEEALSVCGNLFSKLGYKMMEEEGYRGILQGGGARNVSHFTEMVGSSFECTVNYVFLKQMNETAPAIENRHRDLYAPGLLDELRAKLPFYSAAIDRDSLTPEQFDTFPPFAYFRGTFVAAAEKVFALIRAQRG